MAVLIERAKSRDLPMPIPFAKPRSGGAPHSPSAPEEPYHSAVHVNASAVSSAPVADTWLLPQPQLRDPRLPDMERPLAAAQAAPPPGSAPSERSLPRSPTAAGTPQTPHTGTPATPLYGVIY